MPYEDPEIFNGSFQYDEKVDIYSWAIVINGILQEKMPWKEFFEENPKINDYQFKKMVEKGKRPDLVEDPKYKEFQELIERGWNKNPKERPSISEIIVTLLNIQTAFENINQEKLKIYQSF